MRKIIVYIATSADGFIARPDGDVAWLDRPAPRGNYGMASFYRSIDTVVMGRKTYSVGRKLGQAFYPGKTNYVFSRTDRRSRQSPVEFVSEAVAEFAKRLRSAPGKDIWLVGGAELIGAFLDAEEIDEFMIHVVPVLIGAGIPLVNPQSRSLQLKLLAARAYSDGVVRLHYSVLRDAARKSAVKRARTRRRA